jgi:Ser/Thr protein kinase RdoA (MazF antagonist)
LLGPHRIWKGDIGLLPLSSRERRLVEPARKKLAKVLSRHPKSRKNFGLIHADLHTGNFLFPSPRIPAVIDFDDCGYGYYMYDLAVTIAGLRTHPRQRDLTESLMAGYTSEGLTVDEELLRALIGVRYYLILNWFASRLENPKLQARARKIAPAMLENLLKFS